MNLGRTFGLPLVSGLLAAGTLSVLLVQLLVLPLVLLPRSAAFGWVLVPIALSTTSLWSLLHESIHGSLLRDRPCNDRLGRLLAIGYGAPFALLKAGHLLHHRFSRTPRERTEVYDPARSTWRAQAPGYYLRLFGGLYLAEVGSTLLVFAPRRLWQRVARRLETTDTVAALLLDTVEGRRLGQFRLDASLVILVHAVAFVAYGPRWWMLAAGLAARAILVSVTDNAYHYGTALDQPLDAMNLRLPRVLEVFVLSFNLHGVHHRYPGLAWHSLRGAFTADGEPHDLGWWRAIGRQISGPIPADSPRLPQPFTAGPGTTIAGEPAVTMTTP